MVNSSRPSRTGGPLDTVRTAVLAVGFIGVTTGTYLAWQQPATGYEVSIYTATPTGYWVGIGLAFLSAATVTVVGCRDRLAVGSMVLGGMATVTIVGLPVIRGYRLYGLGDAMTHHGWAEELRAGTRGVLDLFYPAAHSIAVLIADTAGVSTGRAMIVLMTILTGLFVLFIPLSAHVIAHNPRATTIAGFGGFMLLPFTTLSTGLHFHTYSIAVLVLPVFIYLLVKYLSSTSGWSTWFATFNGWFVALVAAGGAMLLFHPQVKLNIVILVGALVALHLVYQYRGDHPIADLQSLHLVFLGFAVMWWLWMLQFPEYLDRSNRILSAVEATLRGTALPGETVRSQIASSRAIGVSPAELFVKIFLVPLVFSLFALYAGVTSLAGRVGRSADDALPVVSYFTLGSLVLVPFFLLHFAGEVSHLFFRHVGFVLAGVTIIGGIGIHMAVVHLGGEGIGRIGRPLAVGLLAIAMVLALLVVFPSPYIYNQSHHATDHAMTGYVTAFEATDESIGFSGIRTGPSRYVQGLTDGIENPLLDGLDGEGLADPATALDEPYYLPVARVDFEREVVAYRQLRFDERDFYGLDTDSHVDRVMDNGEFRLYKVDADPAASPE